MLPPLQPNRFWLNVGTIEPRKNQDRLLKAYAELKARKKEVYPLVLAGGSGWLMEDFERKLESLGLRQDVILTGYVDDTALQWLYENCFALVYPSLFEGFGLPVLEAMSLGAPVIASNVTSIPEIVGNAGILVDPLDEEAIFHAMLKLSKDPQAHSHFKESGVERSKLFTWEAAARSVLECYKTALDP
jgi:glycosyltransferase involved in cell wall biosynthesis